MSEVETLADGTVRRLSRDEQRARTRRDLLDAAALVFARQGYHGTSVDQVAEAAGYTKGAVYSNFESKEELFLTLFEEHLDQAIGVLEEVLLEADPSARARLFGERRAVMEIFRQDWFLLETEFALYAARNEDVRERMAGPQRRNTQRVAAIVERHLRDLGLPQDDQLVDDVTRLLIAVNDGLMQMSLTQPETDSGRLVTLLVQLLERAARSGP